MRRLAVDFFSSPRQGPDFMQERLENQKNQPAQSQGNQGNRPGNVQGDQKKNNQTGDNHQAVGDV